MGKPFDDILLYSLREKGKEFQSKRIYDKDMNATVGASDLACIRKACMDLMNPPERTLDELLLMKKGNVAEHIFLEAFEHVGVNCESQRSYYGAKDSIFSHMKVHPDMVTFVDKIGYLKDPGLDAHVEKMIMSGKKIWLNELKTTGALPDAPHFYWELQVMIQTGLIAETHGISPEQIDSNLVAINLNNGKRRLFHIKWDEDVYFDGMERSLLVETFKEEIIEIQMGTRIEFTLTAEEMPCTYNPGVCANCDHASSCPIFGKKGEFKIATELDTAMFEYIEKKDRFNIEKDEFDENIRPIFEKMGKSGVGDTVEGKFTPGKTVPILIAKDLPREEVERLAKEYPAAVSIDTNKLKYLSEIEFINLSKKYGTEKITNQRLIVKKKKK